MLKDSRRIPEVPFTPSRRFSVSFFQENNRKPSKFAELEQSIEVTWSKRVAENQTIFNGSKFRLARVSKSAEHITLHLGMTDYKTYLATHAPPQPLQRFGPECMAFPLGNVLVPITQDGYTFVLIRSGNSAEGKFKCVFPGGHAEPGEVAHMTSGDCPMIRRELVASARREALEELFLDENLIENIDEMKFLGIVRRTRDWKPSMIFSARLLCDASEVERRYREGNKLQEESVMICRFPLHQILDSGIESVLPHGYEAMPELLGAAALYSQMRQSFSKLSCDKMGNKCR
ncbi:NUDIX hydrolase [Gracilaria domingensis]|nr:NUDIX hydrolase [Gracilaria domingensis]